MLSKVKLGFYLSVFGLTITTICSYLNTAKAQIDLQGTPFFGRANSYDYGASIIEEPTVRHYWWCSEVPDPRATTADPYTTDAIFYRAFHKDTGLWEVFNKVSQQWEMTAEPNNVQEAPILAPYFQGLTPAGKNAATWESAYNCDPSVIKGNFQSSQGTYSFAMYYGATNLGHSSGNPADGANTRIGLAYSNNGKDWIRHSANPVIRPAVDSDHCGQTNPLPEHPTAPGYCTYGAGHPATYSVNGLAGVWLMYTDTSAYTDSANNRVERVYLARADAMYADGAHFTAPTLVTNSGILRGRRFNSSASPPAWIDTEYMANPDFAFDYVGRYWYATFRTHDPRFSGSPLTVERDDYEIGLYRMPESGFPTTGTWEKLGFINTALTGAQVNHDVGILRDQFGNVNVTLPDISILFSAGDGCQFCSNTWDIRAAIVRTNQPTGFLQRSYSSSLQRHWISTQWRPPGYILEHSLGSVFNGEKPGTRPLFGCLNRDDLNDHFISLSQDCEPTMSLPQGHYPLGVVGFIYDHAGEPNTHPLYRCRVNGAPGHFVSEQASCEWPAGVWETTPILLGYALN